MQRRVQVPVIVILILLVCCLQSGKGASQLSTTKTVTINQTIVVTAAPQSTPPVYGKTVGTTAPPTVYSRTLELSPTHSPPPLQYSKTIETTPTTMEAYPQTVPTCPEKCTCLAERTAQTAGRAPCNVPISELEWCGATLCDLSPHSLQWCGVNQLGEDMYCYSTILPEPPGTTPVQPVLGKTVDLTTPPTTFPIVKGTTTVSLKSTESTGESSLPAIARETVLPAGTGGMPESTGIPLGLYPLLGALAMVILVLGRSQIRKP